MQLVREERIFSSPASMTGMFNFPAIDQSNTAPVPPPAVPGTRESKRIANAFPEKSSISDFRVSIMPCVSSDTMVGDMCNTCTEEERRVKEGRIRQRRMA